MGDGRLAGSLRSWFAAAPHIPRLPADEAARLYPGYRLRVLEATFLGYAMFYLVRNNLSVVAKDLEGALGYDKTRIGTLLAVTALSYALGKFLMGAVSDRSDPRKFMSLGLFLTALCNFAFGWMPDYHIHIALWTLNGFFQSMGWPPCGRSMGHWFSEKERGLTFSIWNTSHNVGGGVAGYLVGAVVHHFGGWQYAFYVPGLIALAGSVYLYLRLVDTPQSVGLPPVEEYRNDFTEEEKQEGLHERDLSFRELFVEHVLCNRWVWLLAFANFFAYIVRYSMLDWGPTYVREMKGADVQGGGFAVLVSEFGGIPSTILFGWFSDKLGGRRGMVAALSLVPILACVAALPFVPPGHFWVDMSLLALIGLFIYPVINLIVIQALDITSKKAIGTAAGFIGLFGYVGRMASAQTFGWMLDHFTPIHGAAGAWRIVMGSIFGCTVLAIVFMLPMWRMRPKA